MRKALEAIKKLTKQIFKQNPIKIWFNLGIKNTIIIIEMCEGQI